MPEKLRNTALAIILAAACTNAVAYGQSPGMASPWSHSSPTVSPYINLAVNSNGMSNYTTLVRPMVEDREALLRHTQTLQRLERQLYGAQKLAPANERDNELRSRPGATSFMNLSHYYGPMQARPQR